MPILTVVFEERKISVDEVYVEFNDADGLLAWNDLVSEQGDNDKNAIQWNNVDGGEIEYTDMTVPHTSCSTEKANAYIAAFDAELLRQYNLRKAAILAEDPVAFARAMRDEKIAATDWWATADNAPMSAERTAYRQALRDLPSDSANWNPSWVWHDDGEYYDNYEAELVGVNWPTKPQ